MIKLGVNMEFVRHHDKSFEWGVKKAKEISIQQGKDERGKVTGTPVGCACGDGVVDWKRVIDIVKTTNREVVFSVEVGTVPDAIRSFEYLSKLL